jgi:hypothetical protein
MGVVDLRLFASASYVDQSGGLVVDDVQLVDKGYLTVRLAHVVKVNALPLKPKPNYRVTQHELRLLLSYLVDKADQPLRMRTEEFKTSASHIRRFVTESLGLGMLTAAAESYFGWSYGRRKLAHFDVLPISLAGRYAFSGIRPDLLFCFDDKNEPWWLAGEARGRSTKQPKRNSISAKQRERLDQLVSWSGRYDGHPVTMTWTYNGSEVVQVDLFDVQPPSSPPPPPTPSVEQSYDPAKGIRIHFEADLPMDAVAARVVKNVRPSIDLLYRSAPEPSEPRSIFGTRVRGEWATADLVAQSNLHLFLGILEDDLSPERYNAIRYEDGTLSPSATDQSDIQIEVLDRILIVIARDTILPPVWSEVVNLVQ